VADGATTHSSAVPATTRASSTALPSSIAAGATNSVKETDHAGDDDASVNGAGRR
jgi:hypothetical protein